LDAIRTEEELKDVLIEIGFRGFNLTEGLKKFFNEYINEIGGANEDDPRRWGSFEWKDHKDNDIKIDIALQFYKIEEGVWDEVFYIDEI